jgi:hypothetical protein
MEMPAQPNVHGAPWEYRATTQLPEGVPVLLVDLLATAGRIVVLMDANATPAEIAAALTATVARYRAEHRAWEPMDPWRPAVVPDWHPEFSI